MGFSRRDTQVVCPPESRISCVARIKCRRNRDATRDISDRRKKTVAQGPHDHRRKFLTKLHSILAHPMARRAHEVLRAWNGHCEKDCSYNCSCVGHRRGHLCRTRIGSTARRLERIAIELVLVINRNCIVQRRGWTTKEHPGLVRKLLTDGRDDWLPSLCRWRGSESR